MLAVEEVAVEGEIDSGFELAIGLGLLGHDAAEGGTVWVVAKQAECS